ncbi:hypothetical protein J6590_028864 [Homalodisca vitripennis]|nr:hypothetical protein J6590_028864 [Homalodisca vitripennis]
MTVNKCHISLLRLTSLAVMSYIFRMSDRYTLDVTVEYLKDPTCDLLYVCGSLLTTNQTQGNAEGTFPTEIEGAERRGRDTREDLAPRRVADVCGLPIVKE